MNIESLREYCLSLPCVTEDLPFDDVTLVFRVKSKIFALIGLDRPELVSLKCEPEHAAELRMQHSEIEPAFHMNKQHWNQVWLNGSLSDAFIEELVRHSYRQVVLKITKKARAESPEIETIF